MTTHLAYQCFFWSALLFLASVCAAFYRQEVQIFADWQKKFHSDFYRLESKLARHIENRLGEIEEKNEKNINITIMRPVQIEMTEQAFIAAKPGKVPGCEAAQGVNHDSNQSVGQPASQPAHE